MKYIDICKKWLNLFHLISTFSDVLTSGFPSFHILSILANCFASKFSDLLTFINFMFPTFTQFEKWTVKKSNFDSFQKVIFHSLPVVGQLHNFAFIIRGKLWEVVKNSKRPYLYQKVNNKKSEGAFPGQHGHILKRIFQKSTFFFTFL